MAVARKGCTWAQEHRDEWDTNDAVEGDQDKEARLQQARKTLADKAIEKIEAKGVKVPTYVMDALKKFQ